MTRKVNQKHSQPGMVNHLSPGSGGGLVYPGKGQYAQSKVQHQTGLEEVCRPPRPQREQGKIGERMGLAKLMSSLWQPEQTAEGQWQWPAQGSTTCQGTTHSPPTLSLAQLTSKKAKFLSWLICTAKTGLPGAWVSPPRRIWALKKSIMASCRGNRRQGGAGREVERGGEG